MRLVIPGIASCPETALQSALCSRWHHDSEERTAWRWWQGATRSQRAHALRSIRRLASSHRAPAGVLLDAISGRYRARACPQCGRIARLPVGCACYSVGCSR